MVGEREKVLPGGGKPSRRDRFRDSTITTICGILIRSELDDYIATNSEGVVEIKVTSGGCWFAVNSDTLNVRRCPSRNLLVYRLRVEIFDCDCGTDVEVAVVYGIFRSER